MEEVDRVSSPRFPETREEPKKKPLQGKLNPAAAFD
jgi:hypothetical protein